MTTIAGNGNAGYQDGSGINSKFSYPTGIAIDKDGNIFVSDYLSHRIRKISSISTVTTVAGNGTCGHKDGIGINSSFNYPEGLATDQDGNIFIADCGNNRIRKISAAGVVTTVAGNGNAGFQDGAGINSKFNCPYGVCVDKDGNIFVADSSNHCIRKICANGFVTTVAGDGTAGYQDGDKTNSKFYHPTGVAVDKDGNIFIADSNNHRIRKLSSIGHVTTIAGNGTNGSKDEDGINSQFNYPCSLAIDKSGRNLFVSDLNSHTIRHINFKEWDKIISKWPSTHSLLNEINPLKDKNEHIFYLLFALKNYTYLPDELNLEIVKSFLWAEFFKK